jgi:hypothetical protein
MKISSNVMYTTDAQMGRMKTMEVQREQNVPDKI